jgi:hypothetical protein
MKYPIQYDTDEEMYEGESTVRIKILADCPWKGVVYRYKDVSVKEMNNSFAKVEFTYVTYSQVWDLKGFEEYIGMILNDIIEEYLDEQKFIKNKE